MSTPANGDSLELPGLRFSSEVYSLDTVKKAAYRFSATCSFEFAVSGTDIVCNLIPNAAIAESETQALYAAFRNEVLDQDLRARIASETAPLRNAILALAFSKTGLQDLDEV